MACQEVLSSACCTHTEHVGGNLLGHLLPFSAGELSLSDMAGWSPWEKMQFIFTSKCVPYMHCLIHGKNCMMEEVDIDISGFPCVDYSPAGTQKGIYGVTLPVLLALLKWHRSRKTKVVFLENVPEFPVEIVNHLMDDMYAVRHFYMKPADSGCEHLSRMRVFMILTLRGLGLKKMFTLFTALVYQPLFAESPVIELLHSECY